MRKFNNKFQGYSYLIYRWINALFDPLRLIKATPRYIGFFSDWVNYSKLDGAEAIRILDTYPCIHEKTQTTSFDAHYFYQDIWAFKKFMNPRQITMSILVHARILLDS